MGEVVLGVVFVVVGAACAAIFGRVATLTCRRGGPGGGACELTDRWLGGTRVTRFPLAELKRAAVVSSRRAGDTTTYRVELLRLGRPPLPLSGLFSSGSARQHRLAERINAFLADPREETLTVVQDDRLWASAFGVVFAACGLALLAGEVWERWGHRLR